MAAVRPEAAVPVHADEASSSEEGGSSAPENSNVLLEGDSEWKIERGEATRRGEVFRGFVGVAAAGGLLASGLFVALGAIPAQDTSGVPQCVRQVRVFAWARSRPGPHSMSPGSRCGVGLPSQVFDTSPAHADQLAEWRGRRDWMVQVGNVFFGLAMLVAVMVLVLVFGEARRGEAVSCGCRAAARAVGRGLRWASRQEGSAISVAWQSAPILQALTMMLFMAGVSVVGLGNEAPARLRTALSLGLSEECAVALRRSTALSEEILRSDSAIISMCRGAWFYAVPLMVFVLSVRLGRRQVKTVATILSIVPVVDTIRMVGMDIVALVLAPSPDSIAERAWVHGLIDPWATVLTTLSSCVIMILVASRSAIPSAIIHEEDLALAVRSRQHELKSAVKEAEARVEGLRILVRYLGHELRNPLHVCTSIVETLMCESRLVVEEGVGKVDLTNDDPADVPTSSHLDRSTVMDMFSAVSRLSSTVGDVIDFVQMLDGTLASSRSEVDLHHTLQVVARSISFSLDGGFALVPVEGLDTVPRAVTTSGARLQQVLEIGWMNAVQAVQRQEVKQGGHRDVRSPVQIECKLLRNTDAVQAWLAAADGTGGASGGASYDVGTGLAGQLPIENRADSLSSTRSLSRDSRLHSVGAAVVITVRDCGTGLPVTHVEAAARAGDVSSWHPLDGGDVSSLMTGASSVPHAPRQTVRTTASASLTTGTGIRLRLARHLARTALGGRLVLANRKDGVLGCDFSVLIPLETDTQSSTPLGGGDGEVSRWPSVTRRAHRPGRDIPLPRSPSQHMPSGASHGTSTSITRTRGAQSGPLRILVADDESSNLRLLERMLRRDGHDVTSATDGVEVLKAMGLRKLENGAVVSTDEAAAGHSFDVLMLDIRMHEMHGTEAAEAIRAAGIAVPIVFCTGYSGVEQTDAWPTYQPCVLLEKPFSVSSARDALREVQLL